MKKRAVELRDADPEHVLRWASDTFGSRVALTVSFGGPGVVLAHIVSRVAPALPVVFLDTGMLFAETYEHRRTFADRYGLNVRDVRPLEDPGALYATDPDQCCAIRKVEPMVRALNGVDAWVSAVRRDQGASRAATEVVELHELAGRPLIKIHPLAYWDRERVWRYIADHEIPYNPLLDRGYKSLGCWPCTRPTGASEDERAGRWSGTGKTECGLHTFTART